MRLIDGDAIIEEYCGDCAYRGTELCDENMPSCGTAGWIKDAPTVDAVEVVRCKDCDNWYEKMKVGYPEFGNVTAPCSIWSDQEGALAQYTGENDFCSYGVRRETT